MRRIFPALILVVLLSSLAGCGRGKPKESQRGGRQAEEDQAPSGGAAAQQGAAEEPKADTQGREVKLVSWNLHWFPGHKRDRDIPQAIRDAHVRAVAKELKNIDADIILLQEVKELKPLLAALPEYKAQVYSDFHGSLEVAIISRNLAAVAAAAEEFKKGAQHDPPRGFAHATFDIGGHRLLVYTFHFKSNVGGIPKNIPVRERSAVQLLGHVEHAEGLKENREAKSVSVVLGGDLNTDPDAEAFQPERTLPMLREAGFKWGFEGMPPEETITWLSNGRYPDATFDHFFFKTGEGGSGNPSRVIPTIRDVSDHRPVVTSVRVW